MASWKMSSLFKKKAPKRLRAATPASDARPIVALADPPHPAERGGLPRFSATASDQLSGHTRGRIALMQTRVGHAFTPSQPIADRNMFAGREELLRAVISSIENERLHIVLYGERGIGKTSLLHMLSQAASEARYIVIYTSCGADSNFDETFRAAAADIPVLFHSGFSPTAEQAERGVTLADLLPAAPITPRQFADLCSKLTGTRVLIVLDEFERCASRTFRRDVAELIKNLSDRLGRVQLVLAGVASDLTQLVQHIPSIRRNISALRVPKLADEEISQMISRGEREIGLTFEPSARELVVAVARGSPYLANLLCHHGSHVALSDGRTIVSSRDLVFAVSRIETDLRARIGKESLQQINRLAAKGAHEFLDLAVRAALSSDGPINAAEVREVGRIGQEQAEGVLTALAAEGLLKTVGVDDGETRYEFAEEGLPTYLWIVSAQKGLAA